MTVDAGKLPDLYVLVEVTSGRDDDSSFPFGLLQGAFPEDAERNEYGGRDETLTLALKIPVLGGQSLLATIAAVKAWAQRWFSHPDESALVQMGCGIEGEPVLTGMMSPTDDLKPVGEFIDKLFERIHGLETQIRHQVGKHPMLS